MRRFVIGIVGFKRSGKDTFAQALRDVFDGSSARIAFADQLRKAAAVTYGVDAGIFTDDARKDSMCPEWNITYRQMLINLGEAMRGVDPAQWVKLWRRTVEAIPSIWTGDHDDGPVTRQLDMLIVAPDVRHLNEAEAIREMGGALVRVRRSTVVWDGNPTENRLADYPFDYVVDNNADFDHLRSEAHRVLADLRTRC
jgi:hypothetical protein